MMQETYSAPTCLKSDRHAFDRRAFLLPCALFHFEKTFKANVYQFKIFKVVRTLSTGKTSRRPVLHT